MFTEENRIQFDLMLLYDPAAAERYRQIVSGFIKVPRRKKFGELSSKLIDLISQKTLEEPDRWFGSVEFAELMEWDGTNQKFQRFFRKIIKSMEQKSKVSVRKHKRKLQVRSYL